LNKTKINQAYGFDSMQNIFIKKVVDSIKRISFKRNTSGFDICGESIAQYLFTIKQWFTKFKRELQVELEIILKSSKIYLELYCGIL